MYFLPGGCQFPNIMMKSIAIEIEQVASSGELNEPLILREKIAAYLELTKPRITLLIALIAAAGFCLGAGAPFDYIKFTHTLMGIALLCSGVSTLNQYMERDLDGLMKRTTARPLPSGRLSPKQSFVFGMVLTTLAEAYLAVFVNQLTAVLGLTVVIGYVLCYTPLKTKTSLSTAIGAVPGAMPPLMGWAAATNQISLEAWVLFAILFLWQFPHFLAIAWMYREDYARAGIRMLPVVEPEGRVTGQQIIAYTMLLVPVSLLPVALGMSGSIYLYGALLLGAAFLWGGVRAALSDTRQTAKRLLLISVLYLPALFILMVVNK